MTMFRALVTGSVGMLLLAAPAFGQRVQIQAQKIQLKQIQVRPIQLPRVQANAPLLTDDAVAKLKLTDDQKAKYAKIDGEYKEKQAAGQAKFQADIQGVRDREKFKVAQAALQEGSKKNRDDHLAKIETILTKDQKTVFAEAKTQQPQPRPNPGVIRPIQIGGPGIGQILPIGLQRRLNLTEEQQKQIDAIQKEVEAKVMKVLTEEQKKQLEQIKKGGVRPLPIRPVQPNPRIQPAVPNLLPANPAKKDD